VLDNWQELQPEPCETPAPFSVLSHLQAAPLHVTADAGVIRRKTSGQIPVGESSSTQVMEPTWSEAECEKN